MDAKKRAWIYAGIALAAGVGLVSVTGSSSANSPVKRQIYPGARVLLLGDSLAQGLATPMRQLATESGAAFASEGRMGTRIAQWAAQPSPLVGSFRPTLILVSLGTNDMKMPDPSIEKADLDRLLAALRASGATVLWIMPPAMPFQDRGVRAMIEASGVAILRSEGLSIQRAADGIHPTAAGYAGWAGALWRQIDVSLPLAGMPRRMPTRRAPLPRIRSRI